MHLDRFTFFSSAGTSNPPAPRPVPYLYRKPRTVTAKKKKHRHKLTWAAATERLADAAVMNVGERKRQKPVADNFFTVAHAAAGAGPTGDLFRLVAGADSAAWQVCTKKKRGRDSSLRPPPFVSDIVRRVLLLSCNFLTYKVVVGVRCFCDGSRASSPVHVVLITLPNRGM